MEYKPAKRGPNASSTVSKTSVDQPLLPARMVNEYVYCPRLAYLEWVQGEWEDSRDTVGGQHHHRRVDQRKGKLPQADELTEDDRIHARSVTLSSESLGVIARMDLIEGSEGKVKPVDYKRGKRPHVKHGAWEPERVQVCVQGLILREQGYTCEEGVLYFAGSKERVRVVFDDELLAKTQDAISGLRRIAAGGQMPPPLEDSPKCPRCSLVGICLPDEVNYLKYEKSPPRPMSVVRDQGQPVYVQAHRAKVAKRGETLEISIDDKKVQTARLIDVSQLVLMGNVYVTTPTLQTLMSRGIPISWHGYGGWFHGHSVGTGHKNVELRTAQYRASFDEQACLRIAKGLIDAKIHNCRVLLRRNWKHDDHESRDVLEGLSRDQRKLKRADNIQTLLGLEGSAASRYFRHFQHMLRGGENEDPPSFDFQGRNRRPPTDPVNALLSFAYTLLTRNWLVTLTAVGFDAYRGFYHQPRYGSPALALDMMEPFRPLIADSVVIQAINNGEVRQNDFIEVAGRVALRPEGRKRFIAAFERRMRHEIVHPLFGYRVNYQRMLEIQARLLGRHLLGELTDYPNLKTR
ncbi:MAG TPA: CRISPR-associated endonuclease Cas1 [Guyparkeria sp.]|nr:CRISPR-associated endonuclease Cas1 [Guyparkeria sp.]